LTEAAWEDPNHGPMPVLQRLIRDNKVVRGKRGWLFLANDSNDVMAQHAGTRTLSAEEIERWRACLEDRTARLAEKSIPYFCVIAPDTHSVYPEMLPDGFEPTQLRPIHKLLFRLHETGSPACLIYPLEDLIAEKPNRLVYSAFDSHWTTFGALVAYTRLMKDVRESVEVRELDPADIRFTTRLMPGELAYKLGFDGDVEHLQPVFPVTAHLVEDNQVANQGSYAVTECGDAPHTTCLLFGDSYSLAILPYLAESFGRLVYAHCPWHDYGLIERERPDVVVSLFAERFLIYIPDDSRGSTLAELARKKVARGSRRPRMPMWD
jgi:alginate O-acetyltransferase complex protein AlgJ